MKLNYIGMVLATGLLAIAGASAQSNTAGSSDKMSGGKMRTDMRSGVSAADKKFMMTAAEGGMVEVELGRVAAAKGSSDGVKKFGQQMVDDHTKANDELKSLAASKGVTLPTSLNAKDQALVSKMNGLSGTPFDKAYVDDMVKDHKKDVADFQKASNTASDADVKAFAAKTLPTLQEHLKTVQDLHAGMGGKMGADHKM